MATTSIDIGPINLGDIECYAGDPLDISVTLDGENYPNDVFASQIRLHRTDATPLLTFTVTSTIITGDPDITDGSTRVDLHLDGDSMPGIEDGLTRLIVRTAHFDIQRQSSTGEVEETIAQGRLKPTKDVTR